MELIIVSKAYGTHTVYYDDEDHELASKYHWIIAKGKKGVFYVRGYRRKKMGGLGEKFKTRMHRLIMGCSEDVQIDHVNGDGLDNRRSNLRIATNAENCRNKGIASNNSTGYKGVTFQKKKKLYHARIIVNGRLISCGRSKDPVKAAKKYNEAAIKHFGEFAFLNKIPNE